MTSPSAPPPPLNGTAIKVFFAGFPKNHESKSFLTLIRVVGAASQ